MKTKAKTMSFLRAFIPSVAMASLFAADLAPNYSCAFHPGGQEVGKQYVDGLRTGDAIVKGLFGNHVDVYLTSSDVRIGGGRLALSGKWLDSKTGCVVNIMLEKEVVDPHFTIPGLAKGKYAISYSVEGERLFMSDLVVAEDGQKFEIKVNKARTVSGTMHGVPVWAQNTPLVYSGYYCGKMAADGQFTVKTYAVDEALFVDYYMVFDPSAGIGGRQRFRLLAQLDKPGSSEYSVKTTGDIKDLSIKGKIAVSDEMQKLGFGKLLGHIEVTATSAQIGVKSFGYIGSDFGFVFYGLPVGTYSIGLNDSPGNPPLRVVPATVEVVAGQAASVELTFPSTASQP